MVRCPECDSSFPELNEDALSISDELTCEECASDLVVINVDPVELGSREQYSSEVDAEFEDDEDDDDEDLDDEFEPLDDEDPEDA